MPYVTADRSLPRSLDVQISLSRPQAETRTNLTVMCIACESLGFLHNSSRIRFYSTIEAVEDDFAPGTEAHFAASAFFSQSPRPVKMALGEIFLDDQPAMLVAPAYTAAMIALIEVVTNGSMDIVYDIGAGSQTLNLTGLDFSDVTTVAQIVQIINDAIGSDGDLECVVKTLPGGSSRLVIESTTAGDDITISSPVAATSGTFVGTLLGLTTAGSVTSLNGYTSLGIADELSSILNAAATADEFIYGWCFGASLRVVEYQTAAAVWALARTAVMSLCTNSADALDSEIDTDIGSVVYATDNKRIELRYHDNAQQYPDVSMMAYMLSVNYQLKDSTVTSKFKQLPGVSTVQLTETEWIILQSKGYNTYTAIGNDARTNRDGNMASPGWWYDTVVNLDNFVEDLSVNVFNVFLRNKKVPYTRVGQQLLADPCRDTGFQYVYNGTFADREETDITKKTGFSITPAVQVLPTPIANMSVADRAERIGPPVEMICQEAGAIHSVAINVEVVS